MTGATPQTRARHGQKEDGIAAIVATNLNPLVDPAQPHIHRFFDATRGADGKVLRVLVLAPGAIEQRPRNHHQKDDHQRQQSAQDFSNQSGPLVPARLADDSRVLDAKLNALAFLPYIAAKVSDGVNVLAAG